MASKTFSPILVFGRTWSIEASNFLERERAFWNRKILDVWESFFFRSIKISVNFLQSLFSQKFMIHSDLLSFIEICIRCIKGHHISLNIIRKITTTFILVLDEGWKQPDVGSGLRSLNPTVILIIEPNCYPDHIPCNVTHKKFICLYNYSNIISKSVSWFLLLDSKLW